MVTGFDLPYGAGVVHVDLAGDLIAPRPFVAEPDERRAVEAALDAPIGSARLEDVVRPGERVALIVNDITRLTRSELMLPALVERLSHAGEVLIVFALGIHRRQTVDEQRRIVGDLFDRFECVDHDAFDEGNLVEIGRTSFGNVVEVNRRVWECDRIVLTGEIIPHLIAGYSGGRKSLVPGVAGARTTTFNHNMIFDPRCRSGLLDGNPAHEDLLEACRMASPDFLLNVVLSPDGRLVKAVAGDCDVAHREGCKAVDAMLRVPVEEPYDLLIASAGGFPLDIDLRQAHKGLDNAVRALKRGGSILFFAECRGGSGHPSFDEYIRRYDHDAQMRAALEEKFEVGGHKAWWVVKLGREYDVHLVSELPEEFVRRCHYKPVSVDGYEGRLQELAAKGGRVAVMPHAGFLLCN